jgi:phosphoglycerate dehydrogenase-like enzyme
VGIVGAGKIGQRVIRLLRAFEARVLLCDPFVTAADAVAMGATLTDLPSLLRQSAVVSLHAPAAPATRHMIAAAQLAAMRDGAWLINTARASLVDTGALVAELRSGRLFAALDVFDEEPLPPGSPLRGLPHARLTPHCAFITHPCLHRMGSAAVEEVRRFLSGEPLANEVTLAQRDRLA